MDTNIGIQATTECLKRITHFGSTTWVNICTDKTTTLPWGAGDWVIASVCAIVGLVFLSLITAIIKIIRD